MVFVHRSRQSAGQTRAKSGPVAGMLQVGNFGEIDAVEQ
jgi:hypothetical protein